MKQSLRLLLFCAVITGWFPASTMAQNHAGSDTVKWVAEPVFIQVTPFIPLQQWGGQVTIGQVLSGTEKHIIRQSGRKKVIFKDRIISVGPGFYYQQDLHTNLFLTIDYAFVRRHPSGFYRKFAPLAGISRTFLNATTYTVDDNGTTGIPVVSRDKMAGDWRVMAGFMWGIGKRFGGPKPHALRDVYLTLNVPFYYPNFRSVVLKPFVQVGASFTLNHLRRSFPETVKINHR